MTSSRFSGLHRLTQALVVFSCLFMLALPQADAAPRKKKVVAEKRQAERKTAAATPKRRIKVSVQGRQRIETPRAAIIPVRPSFGQLAGLHAADDPLDLKSSVALVIDQETDEVLLRKNENAVLPIASLTKLMTGVVVNEAQLPMDEVITITQDDVDTEKWSRSRLVVGASLSRGELLHLALMSSENRAAHALGRTFPGGMATFVSRMNAKAEQLGMKDTRYVEPTGLSPNNQSSAHDLALLVGAAYREPLIRELSTSPSYAVDVGRRTLQFNTTNRLVKNPDWDIGLQKTGFINEAGQCLVMQASIAGRKVIMVFLDSAGKLSRLGDAERVRKWVESTTAAAITAGGHSAAALVPISTRR
ncbi:D-alanyl-D-alanine endopeptidase [Pseudorhodoferax soli]|uniref:Murein-DD-endopeptidase n=1 Tax=Pseudorhodoferax soli TaxID=545864 RepID=A0A368XRN4_9BURK|nr:murein-DD-endopeptidase [Pseudorhodoferax soli]